MEDEYIKELKSKALNQADEIEGLRTQLAKANERVAELKHEKESLNMRVSKQKEVIKRYAKEAIETTKTQEAFAIEQKIEGVNWFSENYCDDEHSFLADKAIEQLRKEKE